MTTCPARILTPTLGLFHHTSGPQRPLLGNVTAEKSRRQGALGCAHKSAEVRLEEAGMETGIQPWAH